MPSLSVVEFEEIKLVIFILAASSTSNHISKENVPRCSMND